MNFCSRYSRDVETKETRQPRNYEGDDNDIRTFGKRTQVVLDRITKLQAHKYILGNCDAVAPFRE